MDNGQGEFKEISEETYDKMEEEKPDNSQVFKTGEIFLLKGSFFRIQSIRPKKLVMKLLPQKEAKAIREAEGKLLRERELAKLKAIQDEAAKFKGNK